MNREIIDSLFDKIKAYSILIFPEYEYPSIPEQGLILADNKSLISFLDGDYDKNSEILFFNNEHKFKGKIGNNNEKYFLIEGNYIWPSGQIFEGKFSENNLFKEGELRKEKYLYKGNFLNGIFEGKGEFIFKNNDYIKGIFSNGEINGYATIKKDNFSINGNFVESKPYGKIDKYELNYENHIYEFKNFNFKNGKIEDEQIELKKDKKKFSYIKKLGDLDIESNMEEFIIDDNELSQLNECINLINIKLPKLELPKFYKEGLILKKEDFPILEFKNGEKADIDDEKDENELTVPNGENFIGRLYYKDEDGKEKKYYLKEGKYSWPSGQVYEGMFNENYLFETTTEDSKLSVTNKWIYKGKFKDGKFNDKGKLEFADGKKYDTYFQDNKIVGNTIIKYNNCEIQANIKNSLISGIVIDMNGKKYKIKDFNLNINKKEPLVIIREDDANDKKYTIILYEINNENIKFEKMNTLPNKELNMVLNFLNNKIILENFEPFPLDENSLKLKQQENKLSFSNNIYYNNDTKTLHLQNGEKYEGELTHDNDKYYLTSGEYTWPSGQVYKGKFNNEYVFHNEEEKSILITKNFNYEGGFENGEPKGEGEIKWENDNIIRGKFLKGKNYGNTYVKVDNISFEGNYVYSLIMGYIQNIQILNMDIIISEKLNIEKGKIKETVIKIDNDEFELTEDNRTLLSEKYYKIIETDEEDILLLFKLISKIRKFSLPIYEQPRIAEDGIYIEDINTLENVELAFPNEETFFGNIKKITGNKYMLIEGQYTWPNGQTYNGNFENNRFNGKCGKLKFSSNILYEGGFKYGYFNEYGKLIYPNNDIFEGYFVEGEINKLSISSKNLTFKGNDLDSIKDLNIEIFQARIEEHDYEISEFNINNKNIIYKRDEIKFQIDLSQELKQKIIEILLVKNRNSSNLRNYFYNNSYIQDLSNENKIKILKIENNIYSRKLSKILIYKNRLFDENRSRKNEINKIVGANVNNKMTFQEIDFRLNSIKNLRNKINKNLKLKKSIKNCNFGDIEKNEISRIFNFQMLKEMKKEIELLKKDIITLKEEKKTIEKERYKRSKEIQDLNLYFDLINNNYIKLTKEKNKLDNETKEMQEELKQIYNDNYLLNKYLKSNSGKINNEEIKRNIREFEIDNNRILNEINENQKKINEQNKEKEELLKQIKELQNNKNYN